MTFFSGNNNNKLPSSLPDNWPYSNDEDFEEKPNRIVSVGDTQSYAFKSNFVKTSKYEIYNFLPKFLMEEFNPNTKIANCYFLTIAILQTIPAITNTNGLPTTLIPLIIVVLIDGIFQVLEDLARHRADKEANASSALRFNYTSKSFISCRWLDIEVGDIIKIKSRETIPADIVILGVAEKTATPQGICYVETKSLDGETNLKVRNTLTSSEVNFISDSHMNFQYRFMIVLDSRIQ